MGQDMKKTFPKFKYAYMEGNKIWFVPYRIPALFEFDLISEKVTLIELLPIKEDSGRMFHLMEKKGDILILAPYEGDVFCLIDINNHTSLRLHMDSDGWGMFMSAYHIEGAIYFISRNPFLAKLDCKNETIKLFCNYQGEEIYRNQDKKEFWSSGSGCKIGHDLMIPNLQNSKIIRWNTDTEQYAAFDLGMGQAAVRDMVYADSRYWALPRNGAVVYTWEETGHPITEVKNECGAKYNWHCRFCSDGENVLIIDTWHGRVYKVDRERMCIDEVLYGSALPDFCDRNGDKTTRVRWAQCCDGKLYLNLLDVDQLLEYDVESERLRLLELELENKSEYFQMLQREYGFITETMPYGSIAAVIDSIETNEAISRGEMSCIGKEIFKALIE